MKLDFILGQTQLDALTGAIDEIGELNLKGEPVLVLVPETNSALIERLILKKSRSLVNVKVYSFVNLLNHISLTKNKSYLSRDNAILCIKKIIADNFNNLVCFKKSAKSVGFAQQIYDTIAQFKASQVSPDEVMALASSGNSSASLKLKDLHLIYSKYQEFLGESMLDNCDKLNQLIDQLENIENLNLTNVYFIGFNSLTAQAVSLIEKMAKLAKSVKVACSYPAGQVAVGFENEVYNKVKAIADKQNLFYNPKLVSRQRKSEFENVLNNIFVYPAKQLPNSGAIKVYSAQNAKLEAEMISQLVYNEVKNGVMPEEIAVFCPNQEGYSPYLTAAFEDYSLPYFLSAQTPLTMHPLFRLVLDLVDAVRLNFEPQAVIKIVKNTLLADEFENGRDSFCHYVNKYQISYNAFFSPFVWGKNKEEWFSAAQSLRKNFAQFIAPLKEALLGAKTIGDFVLVLRNFLNQIKIEERLEKLYKLELETCPSASLITEQVEGKLNSVLESLEAFLGGILTNINEFYSLLSSAFSVGHISVLSPSLGQVLITSDASQISPETKVIIICGAIEGQVPAQTHDCGMIVDSELKAFSETIKKKIEPTISSINRREKQKLYELLILPKEKLILTYPDFDEAGEQTKPSSIISNLRRIFDNVDFIFKPLVITPEKTLTKTLLKEITKARLGENDLTLASQIYWAIKDKLDKKIKEEIDFINEEKVFPKIENAKELFFKNERVSISQLETYFSCPLLHFVRFGLRLNEIEDGLIRALDIGNILHRFAELFVKKISMVNDENITKFSHDLMGEVISELEIAKERNALVLSVIEAESLRLAKTLYNEAKNSDFKTIAQELSFGYDGQSVTFPGGIKLVGKIDRVDQWGDYIKLVDYKTGSISVNPADIYYGRKIQLVSYLLAMKSYKNLKPGAVVYFPIHNAFAQTAKKAEELYKNSGIILDDFKVVSAIDRSLNLDNPKSNIINAEIYSNKETRQTGEINLKPNNELVSESILDGIMNYVYLLASGAVEEILGGNVAPSPTRSENKTPCQFCKLNNICGLKGISGVREQNLKVDYLKISAAAGREEDEAN